jgi:DNA-binding NarL/FixJ family response regulator
MDLSEFTVRGHVQQILKLTGATNRTNAVFLAEQAGLI